MKQIASSFGRLKSIQFKIGCLFGGCFKMVTEKFFMWSV